MRFALCSLLLPTIVSAVKFFNKINYLHLHRHCAFPARRSGALPLRSLRNELSSGLSLIIRVLHNEPEHGGSVFLTTLSLPFESLRALSLSKWSMGRRFRVEA